MEIFVDIFYGEGWPGEAVSGFDGFGPCTFCWKTCCIMEVSDGRFNAGEIIDIVDGFCHFWGLLDHEV